MSGRERTIVVMRHAKAEASGRTDHERVLAARGPDDAAEAGAWLAARGVSPDHALVSSAARTQETWEHLCRGAGWDLAPTLDAGLYSADVDTALDLVRALPDGVDTVVVVGHNPTMASLAHTLDDGEGDVAAGNEMATGAFPTSATAVFTFAGAWPDLGTSGAVLSAFHVGRA